MEINGQKHQGTFFVIYSKEEPICVIHEIAPDCVLILRHGDQGYASFLRTFYKLEPKYKVQELKVASSLDVAQNLELLKKLHDSRSSG